VAQIGKGGAAYFQNLSSLRYAEAESIDDFGPDQVTLDEADSSWAFLDS
jgi:hypothetical protein